MNVKIVTVAKQLPEYSRETAEVIPFVKQWMHGQDNRFQRKVIKFLLMSAYLFLLQTFVFMGLLL